MPGPIVNAFVVPVGGAVRFDLPDYLVPASGVTFMSLSRATSGVSGLSTFTTLYSGAPTPAFVDCGDYLPAPLASGSSYVWNVTDDRGTTQVGPIAPVSSMESVPDGLSQMLIRLLQGGVNNLAKPPGINPVQITTQMPQNGWQALPFIVVNLDLIQQTDVSIGEDTPYFNQQNDWSLWSLAKRIWRVSVFSRDAQERDFYRDSLLNIYRVLKATVFAYIGYDVTHSYQAASYTDAKEWEGHTPGFYGADLMLEIGGVFNTVVLTNYGRILEINVGIGVLPDTQVIRVPVPPSA